MRVNTNLSSLISYNAMTKINSQMEKSIRKLSSGLRINSAADDAAGLAMSEKMTAQIRGTDQARRNAEDGISLLQTADGALGEIQSILQRMRELSVQAANDTLTYDDRSFIQLEIDELAAQIDNIANQTQFNKKKILNGDSAILWSASTSDIRAIVGATLLSRDAFGQIVNAEGNYKLTFDEIQAGRESVQKSNIMYLKHGTHEASVFINAASGIGKLSALNMVEGVWTLETRETPFGGVNYYMEGAQQAASASVGIESFDASNTPNIVAPGTYDIRLSDVVPMMADFDEALAAGVVEDVLRSSRALDIGNIYSNGSSGDDFDAVFDIDADATGTVSSSLTYRTDIGGVSSGTVTTDGITVSTAAGAVDIKTDDNNVNNLFTHYAVTETDRRDWMASDIVVNETYVAAGGATLDLNVDYQTAVNDTIVTTLTYRSGDTLSFTVSEVSGAAETITVSGSGITTFTANITAGMDIDQAVSTLTTAASSGVSFTVVNGQIRVSNTSGDTISLSSGGTFWGLNIASVANSSSANGTIRRWTRDAATSGSTMTGIVAGINSMSTTYGYGVTASLASAIPTATQTINISKGSNNFKLVVNSGSTATELDFSAIASVLGTGGGTSVATGTSVYDGGTVSTTSFSNLSLSGLVSDINTSYGGITGLSVNTQQDGGTDRYRLQFQNNSMYSISVAGATIDELLNSGTVINVNRGGTGYSDYVWVDHDISTVVSDQDIYGIRNALNTSLNAALATGGDTITSNDSVSNLVSVSTLSSNAGHIIINNVAASAYKITITEPTPATWTELGFSSSNIISRGGIANGTQEKAYDRYITTVSTVGLDIEQVMDAVNTALSPSPILISAAWGPTGAPVFDTTDVDHYANLRFQNTTTGLARVRYTMNQSGSTATNVVDDNRQLFSDTAHYIWSNQNTASLITATQDSDTWQAHDSLTLEVSYEGNSSINGNLVSGSVTVGNLWEGDDTSNAAKLNTALPGIITYDNFHIIDNNTSAAASTRFSDLKVGDSWIIYTKAGSTGTYTADNVTLSLYDGKTAASDVQGNGITTNIVYSFQDGALDGKGIVFGEMVRTGRGINNPAISNAFEQLYHNIVFGSVNSDQSFQYGERKNAGTYWDNTAGTSAGVYGWYSQAYYGGDTSYFFANGTNPTSVINHAIVYKQNDINASLLFMYDGSAFTVRGKGFDRDGNIVLDDDEQTLSAAEMASLASGGVVTIHGINFTNLQIDTSTLKRGDKFVIDVAAAAKLDGINGGPSNASNFQSTANIAVQGGPFMRDESDWGSSAQYRLANDAEDGLDVKLLGYFVDPINGNNDVSGVGYYDGQFELKSAQNGFVTGSVVGAPDDAAPSSASYHIRAEVNYQGSAIPLAGALVTSVYFSKMEGGEYRAVKDFVGAVGYANEIYGTRPDGTYGPLSGQYNTLNGSLVFDVLEVTASVIKFRIQGHIIDLNGNEWYAEEEEFLLNAGNNTSRDSTVIPPLIPSEVTDPLIIFRDAAFGGLFFDEFTLKDYERWSVGDRFTLALTASGQESPDIDEITFFSDNRGTNMPLSFRFYDGVLDNSNVDLHIYQIANNIAREDSSNMATDQVTDATLSISFGAYHPAVGGVQPEIIKRSASFNTVYQKGMDAGVAHYYSRAEDVAQFWNANGGFTLGSGGEGMTVRLGDGEMKFTIGSGLELGQMARIMSERIWLSLLGQNNGIAGGVGSKLPSNYKPYLMDEEDKYKIVQFVNFTPGSNTNEAVPGTFLAHSVLTGKDNDIKFYGSEDLMKAFNFTHIQEARDTMFNLSISDAHSGRTVTSGLKISAGGRILDVITDGLSLDIDSSIGLTHSTWDSKRGMFQADVKDSFSQFLHLADNATTLQIGANEGENLFLTLSDVTARSLGVDAIDVRNRESAARGLTKIDSAIRKTSSQRAIIGAQVNRLDHTINNLETASLNLTDSMSRIVDADIAREMMEFTKLNIIAQASASILTQANQMTSSILTLMR